MDQLVRDAARKSLESYIFNMKSTVEGQEMNDKISAVEKQMVLDKCSKVVHWIDVNQVGNVWIPEMNRCAALKGH